MKDCEKLKTELIKEHEILKEKLMNEPYTQYQLGYAIALKNIIDRMG